MWSGRCRFPTSPPTTTRATWARTWCWLQRETWSTSRWSRRPSAFWANAAGIARTARSPSSPGPTTRFHTKDTEQYHLGLGGPGLARGDDRRFALRVLDTLLGGSSSSRLFQEVREKRGLAYAVYSYASSFADIGQVGVYVGTRRDNVGEALAIIGEQLRHLQDDRVPAEELDRAKENVKGRTVLSMESTLARMNRLGSSVLMDVPILSLDELLAKIDAVTADDVAELARTTYGPDQMSAAGVGPDEAIFRDGLAGAELAAA